jgi:hypothetical protein
MPAPDSKGGGTSVLVPPGKKQDYSTVTLLARLRG